MELENNFKRKILNGLVRSCEKRPVRYQQLEDITNKVEWQLRDEGQTEISSRNWRACYEFKCMLTKFLM